MALLLDLHDHPATANGGDDEAALAAMSPEERKKHKLAKKKEVRKGHLGFGFGLGRRLPGRGGGVGSWAA